MENMKLVLYVYTTLILFSLFVVHHSLAAVSMKLLALIARNPCTVWPADGSYYSWEPGSTKQALWPASPARGGRGKGTEGAVRWSDNVEGRRDKYPRVILVVQN